MTTQNNPENRSTTSPSPSGSIQAQGDVQDSILVTGSNNFIRVIKQYISSPPTAQIVYKDLQSLFTHYRALLLSIIASEVILNVLYSQYRDQYLLAQESYLLLAGTLIFVVIAWWNGLPRQNKGIGGLRWPILGAILTFAWLGFLGQQVWGAIKPPKFSPEQFGIAIATFGQGPDFQATAKGYEIAERLSRDLMLALEKDPGLAAKVDKPQRIGVVDSKELAEQRGNEINAKLVIWGYLVLDGNNIDVYFNVLQASELIDNPAFPQVIPLTPRLLGNKIPLPYDPSTDLEGMLAEPSLGVAAFSIGLAYYFDRNYHLAIEQFRRALDRLRPDWKENCASKAERDVKDLGLIYFYLGRSYQVLGDFTNSQLLFDCAVKYNPDDLALLLGQAYNYRVMGEKEKQQDTYRRIITLSRSQPAEVKYQAAYNRAIAYEYLHEYEKALYEYTDIINDRHKPDFFIAYLGAGGALTQLNRFDEAEAIYRKADILASSDHIRQVWLEMGKGQLYDKQGDLQAAIAAYQKAIELDIQNTVASAHYYLAQLYAKSKRKEDARQSFKKLIEISQIPSWSHGVYASFLYENGEFIEAIEQFQLALNIAIREDPLMHTRLGLAYAAVDEQIYPNNLSTELF